MVTPPSHGDVSHLVDNMFRDVFTPDERAEFVERIIAMEGEGGVLPPAQRVMAWIDLAYEFQAERSPSKDAPSSGKHRRFRGDPA